MTVIPRDDRSTLSRVLSESMALHEIGWMLMLRRYLLRNVRRGDGHAVLLVPGLTATDRSMSALRFFLDACGYQSHGWEQGRNMGIDHAAFVRLELRLRSLARNSRGKVSLIGWSMGGVLSRELAHRNPALVRQVITLGSPFKITSHNMQHMPEFLTRFHQLIQPHADEDPLVRNGNRWTEAPPVPSTSLYSKRDALAPWPFCQDVAGEKTENIRIAWATHIGLPFNLLAYYLIADRLSQPEGKWAPFRVEARHRLLFRQTCGAEFAV